MGEVGGPRHFTGVPPVKVGAWTCPACGTEHLTKLELGCPSCGAATPEQTAAAQLAGRAPKREVAIERLIEAIVKDGVPMPTGIVLDLAHLTPAARFSIAVALAHYADHGDTPSTQELPRVVAQSWARYLYASVTAELDAKPAPVTRPDTPKGDPVL